MLSYLPKFYEIFDTEGELFIIIIFLLILLFILVIQNLLLKKFNKVSPKLLIDVKNKMMWGTILRVILEGYSQMILKDFQLIYSFSANDYF